MTAMASPAGEQPHRVLVPLRIAPARPAPGSDVHVFDGRTMGTTWQVKFVGPRSIDRSSVECGIVRELDAVIAEMSTWETESDLSRFNQASAGARQPLPPAFHQVLTAALEVAQASDGAFDPTAGALVDLWGFGPEHRHDEPAYSAPSEAPLAAARARCGWRRLELLGNVVHQPGGCQLDLSGIAKGFAVDQVARYLVQRGFEHCLVEVGGELQGHGVKPDGQPWWVALEQPPRSALPPTLLATHGVSVATSGDYRRRYREPDGRWRSHTIDPRSGRPIEHGLASVTVVHDECMLADAWSTALTVLGVGEGYELAEAHGLAALFIVRHEERHFTETMTPALEAMLA